MRQWGRGEAWFFEPGLHQGAEVVLQGGKGGGKRHQCSMVAHLQAALEDTGPPLQLVGLETGFVGPRAPAPRPGPLQRPVTAEPAAGLWLRAGAGQPVQLVLCLLPLHTDSSRETGPGTSPPAFRVSAVSPRGLRVFVRLLR